MASCVPYSLIRVAPNVTVWRVGGNESYKVAVSPAALAKDQSWLALAGFPNGVVQLDVTYQPWLDSIPTMPIIIPAVPTAAQITALVTSALTTLLNKTGLKVGP